MALVKSHTKTEYESYTYETEYKYDGKPIFRVEVDFVNNKPRYQFKDGPNAYVQMAVSNRQSMEDWRLNIKDLQHIREACDQAIAHLKPFAKPMIQEVK